MNIVTEAKVVNTTSQEKPWKETQLNLVACVRDEPQSGFLRQITLNAQGVVVRQGQIFTEIPLSVILSLAEQAEPALVPPATPDPET